MSLPKLQKMTITNTVQVPKKIVVTQMVEKTVTTYKNVILHKDVEYKDKKYVIGYCPFNDTEDYLFVIDFDQKEKVINKKWHYRSEGDYIGNTHVTEDGITKQLYLHNFVMNKLTFDCKGQHHSIDHINRIGRDNRIENLRELSQSHQNINQQKKDRNIELPDGCGINPQDIPKNIYYRKPEGLHGDRFYIDIKFSEHPFRWYSSSSKKIDLKTKLQHAKLKLEEFKQENPKYALLLETLDNLKQRNDLRKSFNDILQLSGFPQEIINKNLATLEEEKEEKVDQDAKELAQQLINEGIKGVTSNLPQNCGVTQEMIPKYCYYKPASDKRGDKFIIERHPTLVKQGLRQWATTEAKSKTTKEKFDLMIQKLTEL
jgi:hypothetical protein